MNARRTSVGMVLTLIVLGGCGDSAKDQDAKEGGGDNGVASKSASQIVSDSAAALKQARSAHLEGTVSISGDPTEVKVDLEQPEKIKMTFTQKPSSATLIVVGSAVYMKANAAFWRQQKIDEARAIANQWFKLPGSDPEFRELTNDLSLEVLSRCLVTNHGTLSVAGKSTVNGQPAVVVVDKGDRPGTAPGKLFVATTGEPLPLRVVTTGKQRRGGKPDRQCNNPDSPASAGDRITFSRYGDPLNIEPPADARDLDPGAPVDEGGARKS